MHVYEEDVGTHIKSAISGTLIRGISVQVQKAKVYLSYFPDSRTLEFYTACKTYSKFLPFPPYLTV